MVEWNFERLNKIVQQKTQEKFDLEFKPCDELRWGEGTYNPQNSGEPKTRDDVLDELSRDVSSMANSAGGTIIYGIKENHKTSTAKSLDNKPFNGSEGKVRGPEWLDEVIRSNVSPSPNAKITPIFDHEDKEKGWYYIVEIEQGITAHQARDKKFYRRHNTTRSEMEQHEILDVINRSKGPIFGLRWKFSFLGPRNRPSSIDPNQSVLKYDVFKFSLELTSINYLSADYGAARVYVLFPIVPEMFIYHQFDEAVSVGNSSDLAKAKLLSRNWSVHQNFGVYPGYWTDLGMEFNLVLPRKEICHEPLFLLKTEINGPNTAVTINWHPIVPHAHKDYPWTVEKSVKNLNESLVSRFWNTYNHGLTY